MLVANSFDLWQRDAFFSAAEEVQESTDILESAYRTWLRGKREGISSSDLDELRRELQTALGTAKWQLDEFERAVRSSYGNCRDHSRMARHQQFVGAIESQISRVEDALTESLNEDGKQPLRWVNLDEDERDDLAMFLAGFPRTPANNARDEPIKPSISSSKENQYNKTDLDYASCSSSNSLEANIQSKCLTSDIVINIGPPNCEGDRTYSTKRTWVSPKSGTLKIVVPDEDSLMPSIEATPKEKGFRTSNCLHLRGINCINKLFKRSSVLSNIMQSPRRLQFSSAMRLILVFMLSFILLVPYLMHSS